MLCKKCKKEIDDSSLFCNWCGKKQETTKRKNRRRVKGTGTIRYRSDYTHNHYVAYSPNSKMGTKSNYIGCFSTYKEAQQALDSFNEDRITDLYNCTLSEIYEKWSKEHFTTLTKSGIQGYTTAYKYLSDLYSSKMRLLKTKDYQNCVNQCSEKYSRSQCEKIKQLCSQLCKYAMMNDVINKNYAQFITLPKGKTKEREVFSEKELNLLWQNSADRNIQIILILCYTGFRINELFSIKKENVNLDEGFIIGGNKTQAGKNRFVPISDKIIDFVKYFYNSSTTDYLFNDDSSNFRKRKFYPALSELGIIDQPQKNNATGKLEYKNPRLTPHCTRHTFATLCKNAGVEPEQLQKLIGHSKYETTANIYIHESQETLKAAIRLI